MSGVVGARAVRSPGQVPPLVTATAAAGVVALTLLASLELPPHSGPVVLLAGVTLVVAVWMAKSQKRAHALAALLLFLGLLDGVLKLSVPIGNELPGLARDVLLYAIAVGMLVQSAVQRHPVEVPPLTAWVLAFVAIVLVQLLNPENGSLAHSAASLRQHLEFIPLFFIGYSVMRTRKRLQGFMLLLLVVGAANGIAGAIQFNLTADQLANWGPGYRDLVSPEKTGGAPRQTGNDDGDNTVRPPGLGSDMGFGGTVGAVALPSALALLMLGIGRNRRFVLVAALGVASLVAVATSQSRGVVLGAIVAAAAFVALATTTRRVVRTVVVIVVVTFLGLAVLSELTGESGTFDRYASITPSKAAGTTIDSRRHVFSEILPDYIAAYPFGAGIGSVGPAAGVIDPPLSKSLNAESQFTFTVVELGVAGLVLLIALHFRLLTMVVRRVRALPYGEPRLVLAALSAPLFMFVALWAIGVNTTSSPNAPYLWFVAGTLMYWLKPCIDHHHEFALRPET